MIEIGNALMLGVAVFTLVGALRVPSHRHAIVFAAIGACEVAAGLAA